MFPALSVAGYVVTIDLLTHSPKENLPDFSAVNCTCVYKENSAHKQHAAFMESFLGKLNQQEDNCAAGLDAILKQYAAFQQQAVDMDTMEPDTARQATRLGKEH